MGAELAQEREWTHDRELDWGLLADARHEGVRRLVADLNAVQAAHPALWRGDDLPPDTFGWLEADDRANSVFAFWRRDPDSGTPTVVVANLTPVPRHGYRVGVPEGGTWELALDTDDRATAAAATTSRPDGATAVGGRSVHPVAGPAPSRCWSPCPRCRWWCGRRRREPTCGPALSCRASCRGTGRESMPVSPWTP